MKPLFLLGLMVLLFSCSKTAEVTCYTCEYRFCLDCSLAGDICQDELQAYGNAYNRTFTDINDLKVYMNVVQGDTCELDDWDDSTPLEYGIKEFCDDGSEGVQKLKAELIDEDYVCTSYIKELETN